ncbi:hypothetical protein [Robertmurraya kyonggiensis]|uniref:Uncharacterized protein n=1 Tax=Robertmurraya kyonggiensis TaxID=1037680 RepID=A0A4U1D402_9BACI|nr:hypothetical protein [Robertmurraya kyonggiensis]TKC17082.1 hypothetical protein FA727_13585 [Robertmurraya kyonggiensis]
MKKKHFSLITNVYYLLIIGLFVIYASQVTDDNWKIDLTYEKNNLLIFGGLFFIALILTSIDAAGVRDKGSKVQLNTVYAGLSIATCFLVWRLMLSIF